MLPRGPMPQPPADEETPAHGEATGGGFSNAIR
jgi:hypothetical protein